MSTDNESRPGVSRAAAASAATTETQARAAQRRDRSLSSPDFWSTYGIPTAIVVLGAVFAWRNSTFLTGDNLLLIVQQASPDAIAAIGLTIVLIAGGIDISQGATMALAAATTASAMSRYGWPAWASLLAALAMGLLVGLINGTLIEKGKIPGFIVTLASLFIIRGIVLVYLDGQSQPLPPEGAGLVRDFANARLFDTVPVAAVVAVALYVVMTVVLRKTVWGMRVYAAGSSAESASRAGVRVPRLRAGVFALAGLFSAIAGVMLLGRLGSAPSELAVGREFYIVTAVVVGGTSLYGGKGRLWRSFMGAFLVAMLANGLVVSRVAAFYQQIVIGAVLLVALLLDRIGAEGGGN